MTARTGVALALCLAASGLPGCSRDDPRPGTASRATLPAGSSPGSSSPAARPSDPPPSRPAASSPGSAAVPPATLPDTQAGGLCPSMCNLGQQLHCGADTPTCLLACSEMLAPPCDRELRKALECFAREPLAHWECGREGLPEIRSGYCDAAQAEAARCIERESAR